MSFADDYVAAFEPWSTSDLVDYLGAIASMFATVELYAFDTADDEGWTILFDPARCPFEALGYLAQYVGETLPVGIDEVGAREWIEDAPNQLRGTNYAIFRAAQRKLTGQRTVTLVENDGAVDALTVITYTGDTPDPAGTLADLLDVVPADTVLTYNTQDGQSWSDVATTYATWADVLAAKPTWEDVRTTIPSGSSFSRPRP